MDRQPTLIGERLLLRPLCEADWAALYAVARDPLIWALHPAHDRWQEPVFRAFFADALAQGGAVVAIEKSSGAVIGSSRWQGYNPAGGGSVEIGWTFLARSHWGRIWNEDMKRLMLAHAFRWVARVDFRVGEHNLRSRGAIERIGGRLRVDDSNVVVTASGQVRHVIYEITRDSFASGPLMQP